MGSLAVVPTTCAGLVNIIYLSLLSFSCAENSIERIRPTPYTTPPPSPYTHPRPSPGAPTVAELKSMKEEAASAGVSICMGYNKNVCKYVRRAREYAASAGPESHVTFVSNNTYEPTAASLGECFERNAEGMLKNMAIHELALLASFYDVTVDNVEDVIVDEEFSSLQTLEGPR